MKKKMLLTFAVLALTMGQATAQRVLPKMQGIAIGGGMVDGKEIAMQVKAGDRVIYSKYAGNEVKLDGEEYIIVKQSDILAIVE